LTIQTFADATAGRASEQAKAASRSRIPRGIASE